MSARPCFKDVLTRGVERVFCSNIEHARAHLMQEGINREHPWLFLKLSKDAVQGCNRLEEPCQSVELLRNDHESVP